MNFSIEADLRKADFWRGITSGWPVICVNCFGNIQVADTGSKRIEMIAASTHALTTVAGLGGADYSGDGQAATDATLNAPLEIAFDSAWKHRPCRSMAICTIFQHPK